MNVVLYLNIFLQGAAAMASVVAGRFFMQYWRATRDRFFVFFAAAFFVFALNWVALAVVQPAAETRHWFYVLRLLAFVLILVAIVDKNRRERGDPKQPP